MRIPARGSQFRLLLQVGAAGLALGLATWLLLGGHEIDRTKVYRIRYGDDPPLDYRGSDGLPAGLAVELVQEAARRAGIRLEWLHATGNAKTPADFFVLQVVRPQGQPNHHFTAPYLQAEPCFLVRADSVYREEKDLRGARISFQNFAVHRESLALILPEMRPVPAASSREALSNLAEGRAEAAYMNQYSAAANMLHGGTLPAIRIFPTSLPRRDLALGATTAAAAVADEIRREMNAMGEDGTVASILAHWSYVPNLVSDTIGEMARARRQVRWLVGGLIGMGLALSLVVWLAFRSRRQRRALRQAEVALRDSQQRFRTLFEEAGDAILLLEGDRITDCNRIAPTIFGVATREDLVGRTPQEFSPVRQADGRGSDECAQEKIAAALAGISQSFEWLHVRADGTPFHAEVSLTAMSIQGQTCLQAIVRDVSLRRQVENEMRVLLRTAPVGIGMIRQGRITESNEALCEMLGYTREDLLRREVGSLMASGDDADRLLPELRRRLGAGERIEVEVRARRKEGTAIDLLLRVAPIDPSDRAAGQVGIVLDITARKQAEVLQQAKAQAESANQAKSVFLARMSHEIRTPMNAILGFAQLLGRDALLSQAQREHLRIIGRNGEHLLTLIDEILEMSKIEARQVSLQTDRFDLRALANDLHTTLVGSAAAKGLAFTLALAPELPACVEGDAGKFRQILLNLLGNAIKFTSRGHVGLHLRMAGPGRKRCHVVAEVEDSGPGIDAVELDRIFQPFEQTEVGRRSGMGAGLGLAISREFARLMGGDITVESSVGKGSRFRVEVMLQVAGATSGETAAATWPDTRSLAPDGRCCRVLVVDDLEDNRRLLLGMLQPTGCEVREAANGVEALALFAVWKPCVILLDLCMPGLDGAQVTGLIRALPDGRAVKIVCHSASAFANDRERALAAGADDFLPKPLREAMLWDMLQQLMKLPPAMGPEVEVAARGVVLAESPPRLPDALWVALHQAVLELDMARISALVEQVKLVDPDYAGRLGQRAAQFDYEGLAALLPDPAGTGSA